MIDPCQAARSLTHAIHLTSAVVGTSILAQGAADGSQANPYTLRVSARSVVLDVVVTDKHGKLVEDLSPSDFSLFDDSAEQKIVHFSAVTARSATTKSVIWSSGRCSFTRRSITIASL